MKLERKRTEGSSTAGDGDGKPIGQAWVGSVPEACSSSVQRSDRMGASSPRHVCRWRAVRHRRNSSRRYRGWVTNKTRLTTQNKVLDNNQTKTKNRHKNKQTKESTNLLKKDTKRDTSLRDLFRQLKTLVRSHTETQLKFHHNGIKIYKPITRCPMNTKIHTLERQKRHYFRLIQQYVDKHIDLTLHTKNDHSALFKRNRL